VKPGAAGAAAKPRQQSAVTGKPGGCNCLLGCPTYFTNVIPAAATAC